MAEGFLDGFERSPLGLRHVQVEHGEGAECERAEEKVRAVGGLVKEDRGRQRYQPVGEEAQTLRGAIGRRPSLRGLDLAGVDLTHDGPGAAVAEGEDEDEGDDDPASDAIRVDGPGGVEDAHEPHAAGQEHAAGDCGGAAAPSVGGEHGRDGDCEHEDRGHARGEESGRLAGETGFLKERRRILCYRSVWVKLRQGV